ncbi:hypothetical protein VNO78_08214 [Psophocarpus tetragonolobus]|uniref:Uncharacterized protein n=1 Tax=Psophocarpus tetragonolobus TaxID=3891 RepID=A0AAN9SUQ6_PSOTE
MTGGLRHMQRWQPKICCGINVHVIVEHQHWALVKSGNHVCNVDEVVAIYEEAKWGLIVIRFGSQVGKNGVVEPLGGQEDEQPWTKLNYGSIPAAFV